MTIRRVLTSGDSTGTPASGDPSCGEEWPRANWSGLLQDRLDGQAQVEGSEPGRCAISGKVLRTFLSKVTRGRLRCTASSTNRVSYTATPELSARVNAGCHSDRFVTDSIPRRAAMSSFWCPSSAGKTPILTAIQMALANSASQWAGALGSSTVRQNCRTSSTKGAVPSR